MSDAEAIIEEDPVPARPKNPLVRERFEFIYGTEYAMASPNAVHQVIFRKLSTQLDLFFEGKSCMPFTAFDVYILADLGDTKTFVEPDLLVICDRDRLKLEGYYGAPPFIIEILSQDQSHDLVTKLNLYYRAGAAEYIVIDPENKIVMAFTRGEGAFQCQSYFFSDKISSSFFPGLVLDLSFDLPF